MDLVSGIALMVMKRFIDANYDRILVMVRIKDD